MMISTCSTVTASESANARWYLPRFAKSKDSTVSVETPRLNCTTNSKLVGVGVGTCVGQVVGASVGNRVGVSVGTAVGALLGDGLDAGVVMVGTQLTAPLPVPVLVLKPAGHSLQASTFDAVE